MNYGTITGQSHRKALAPKPSIMKDVTGSHWGVRLLWPLGKGQDKGMKGESCEFQSCEFQSA